MKFDDIVREFVLNRDKDILSAKTILDQRINTICLITLGYIEKSIKRHLKDFSVNESREINELLTYLLQRIREYQMRKLYTIRALLKGEVLLFNPSLQ